MLSTKIGVLLDATGSMAADRERTIDGFNEYLTGLKEDANTREALFTVAKFNSAEFAVLRKDEIVSDAVPITAEEYSCDFSTPLFDATARMIGILERGAQADRNIMVVMTDGLENASQETDFRALTKLIEEKRASGNWTFVFLGADLDAWDAQAKMGVQFASPNNTMSYGKQASNEAYRGLAGATADFVATASCSTERFFGGDRTVVGRVPDAMLPPDQAAATLGMTSTALAKMRQAGTGPKYARLGHRTVRYSRRDIDDWKAAQTITTSSGKPSSRD